MALVPYPNVISGFVIGLGGMADAVTYITDRYVGGSLLVSRLSAVSESYSQVLGAETLIRDKALGSTADQAYILAQLQGTNMNGLTLAEIGTGLTNLGNAFDAWIDKLNPFLQTHSAPVFGFSDVTINGQYGVTYTTKILQFPNALPETQGLLVKNAPETAALRTALVNLRAIEV